MESIALSTVGLGCAQLRTAAAASTPRRATATTHRRNFTTRLYKLWRRFDEPQVVGVHGGNCRARVR